MRNGRPLAALACVVVLATGCSSDPPVTLPTAPSTTSATQWWTAADYCGILRQTVRAGGSLFPGATAGDQTMVTATSAFTSAVARSAPDAVSADWAVLSPVLTKLVSSGGSLSDVGAVDAKAVASAATAIAKDAKSRCHLDLGA